MQLLYINYLFLPNPKFVTEYAVEYDIFIEYYALHVSRDFCNKCLCYLLVKTSICENRFSSLMGFQHLYSIIKCNIKYNLSYALLNRKHTSNPVKSVNIPLTSISLNMSMLVIK